MIELAFLACLALSPATCRDQQLLFADVPLIVCMLQGQTQLAAWAERNPGWEVSRWECRPHDPSRPET